MTRGLWLELFVITDKRYRLKSHPAATSSFVDFGRPCAFRRCQLLAHPPHGPVGEVTQRSRRCPLHFAEVRTHMRWRVSSAFNGQFMRWLNAEDARDICSRSVQCFFAFMGHKSRRSIRVFLLIL